MTEERRNPYVGPRPFTAEEASRFFGRDVEASEILSLILAYPAIVLFSESGAGKTSILNARVIPGLLERECDVIGPVRVSAEFGEGFVTGPGTNVYMLSALLLMDRDNKDINALSRLTFTEYLTQRPRRETQHAIRPPRIVIFDQFEELFTTRPERWQDRAKFMQDIGDALEADPRLRVVFALREEFIASVDALACELPDGLRTRFRLERLRRIAALDAVEKPLTGTGVSFAPGVSELLVDNLLRIPSAERGSAQDEFVEPVHLQLVCHRVWESLAKDAVAIQTKDVETHGNVDAALGAYYDFCIQRVAQQTGRSEFQLRSWFQKNFVTSESTRGLVYRTIRNTGGLPNDVADRFQALYLIRAESRGGSRWFELAHDRLIAPIIESNRAFREKRQESTQSIDALERRSEKWLLSGHSDDLLLQSTELAEARGRLRDEGETFAASEALREFLAASDIACERRRTRRLRQQLFAGVAAVLVLLAVVVSELWLIRERDEARSRERKLVANTLLGSEKMEIEGLMWALRAYHGTREPDQYRQVVRTALDRVGPTVWLRRETPIQNALFSPMGEQIVTISGKELCVWDAATGIHVATLKAPENRIWREAFFSRSGRYVMAHSVPDLGARKRQFTAGTDVASPKEFIIWQWRDKTVLPQLKGIPRQQDISVAPSDTTMAIAYEPALGEKSPRQGPRKVRLFDLKTNKELRPIWTERPVDFISLSKEATRLMTVESDRVRIYDTATGRKIGDVQQDIGIAYNTIVKWADEDTMFVAFQATLGFRPTLVHIRRSGLETIQLKIPITVLDAWFHGDGRLIVKTVTANSSGRVIGAFLIDGRGRIRKELPEEVFGESYHGYARYFDDGHIVSIESKRDSKGTLVGYTYRVGNKIVFLRNLKFDELTSLSTMKDQLLSVAHGVAKIWNIDQAHQLDSLPDSELVTAACSRFVNQPDMQRQLASEQLCVEKTLTTVRAQM